MSMMNRNRRSNTTSRIAPSFRLNDVPERTLLPMVPVGMDSMGNTTYAPRPTTTTTTTTTGTTGTTGLASHRNTGSATNSATNVGQKKKSPDDDDKKGGDHDGKSHHRHRHSSSSSSSESQQQHHHHNHHQQAQDDTCCTSTTAACVIRNALYLGGEGDANSATLIRKLRIRRILNVADEIRVKGCWLSSSEGKKKEEEGDEAAEKLPPAAVSVVSPVSAVSVVSSLSSNCSSAAKVAAVPWSVEVKHIKIRDHSDENISAHFDEAIRFIREGILKNEPVLVHCRFGVSRSATIVIAYLMKYGAVSLYPSPSSNVSSTSISTAGAAAAAAAATAEANNNSNSNNSSLPPLSPLSRPHLLPPPTPRPMSFQDSFDYVKARRPQVSPNLGFCLALHRLDSEMNRSPLVTASP